MAKRVEQVESVLKRAVSSVVARGLGDPRTEGALVTVTRVKVSPDLRDAIVHVSVTPERLAKRTVAALRHAARHIGNEARRDVALRTMPHLDFRHDEKLKKQSEIYDAIQRGMRREEDTHDQ